MSNLTLEQKLHYTLRLGTAMCFIGHGSFGIITKAVWCNYFAVFGISHNLAYRLMPVVGVMDILCGIIILIRPIKAFVLWLVIWGFITASLRPLAGESFAELIERAGNFGAPLALLILSGSANLKDMFKPLDPDINVDEKTLANVFTCLRVIVFLLLVGHGWLNIIGKKGLLDQYHHLGFNSPANVGHVAGAFEITAGLLLRIRPFREIIVVLLIWKIATELFYPHYEIFEWIERGGSYSSLLALWFITEKVKITNFFSRRSLPANA